MITKSKLKIYISNFSAKDKKKKGFTLIELVAVLAIIAILSAAFAPKIGGYVNEAKKVSVLNEAKDVITAFESISFKNSSLSEDSKVSDVLAKSGDLLVDANIRKLPKDFTITQCRNLIDTEKYTFSMTGSTPSAPTPITE